MNAYFIMASSTCLQTGLTMARTRNKTPDWTACDSLIVCAENAEEAQKRFEEWLCAPSEGENPVRRRTNKIVTAQFFAELLTETEWAPVDWRQIARQAGADLGATADDDFGPGYWLDANAVRQQSPRLEELRQDLPEEIRSGLNWAEEKQFFFPISVLRPPPPTGPADEPEADGSEGEQTVEENAGKTVSGSGESGADFAELAEMEAAVLVRARNSAVAVWLWRRYAAGTELAGNQIRIEPWCGVEGFDDANPEAAIAEYSKDIELDPNDADAYQYRARAKYNGGDWDGAMADYTKVIELKPDDSKAYADRGYSRRRTGELKGAMADFTKAVELNPKYVRVYHARGCLHYDTQAFTDALDDFRKVIELGSSLRDYAHFRIWLIGARLGETEAAKAELQNYLSGRTTGKPDDWEFNIGQFLAGQMAEREFLAAARNEDQKKEAGQLCQAYFYAGSKRLFAKDLAGAADYFWKSIATQRAAYMEYSSAVAELKRLEG